MDRRAEFHPRIESLRGIAALMVAVFHSIHLLPVDGIPHVYLRTISDVHGAQAITTRLLMVFFNGGAAVSLFFVMSGLVLALSLRRDQRPVSQLAPAFAARRFFRIYPTLAFNVLVYAAAMWIVSCEWRWLYRDSPSVRAVRDNLILVDTGVNGATWSLAVELLAVPFILLVHLLTRGRSAWLILLPAALARVALFSPFLLFRFRYLYLFLFLFIWGMAIPLVAPSWMRRFSPRVTLVGLCAGALLLLGARFVFGYWSRTSLGVEGIGATILVSIVAYGREIRPLRFLDGAVVRFLGRTSYSFYLYHPLFLSLGVPIVTAVLSSTALAAEYPLAVGLLIAVVTVLPAALAGKLSFDWIERPSVRLGRLLEDLATRPARS